jgi:hypothetical protein
MDTNQKIGSYSVSYKLNMIHFTKEHGNRAAERHFGPSQIKIGVGE